jgi:glycine reductase
MGRHSAAPPLELGTYEVVEASFGPSTSWKAGNLVVDLESLRGSAAKEPAVEAVEVHLVRPGDPVRVANVLDAVVPHVKADDPEATFPGVLGRLAPAGRGRSNRLGGVTVLSVCDLRAAGLVEEDEVWETFVDMAGPGADRSGFGSTANVVLTFTPRSDAPAADVDLAVRKATLRVARELAATTIGATPDRQETFRPIGARQGGEDLPAIAAILQVGSEGPFLDTFLYGLRMEGLVPTALDPREVLDGALTNGAFEWAGSRNPTALYQRNALIRELYEADGKRLRFAGLVVALGYLNTAFEKQRSAMLSARLAQLLGADGVVCTTFETGNSHTDTMLTVRACEQLGIRTTAILTETNGGLTDHVPEADCIVSVGNEDELVAGWSPDHVIGASAARAGEPVPTWAYLGATCQMGDLRWTAVPA